jgi:hypothetical protein
VADDPSRSTMVYDPELAPPPDPQGDRRLLWIVGVLTVLLLAGMGLALYVRSHSAGKEKNAANAFVSDVRDHRFGAAYARLCPGKQAKISQPKFTASVQNAAAHGHGVRSFHFLSGNSSQHVTSGSGTAHVAQGTVVFTNGQSAVLTLLLDASHEMCVLDADQNLL